jgi:DNA polymerase III subunit delta
VKPDQALAQAKEGTLLPVYILAGEEAFLRDQVLAELRASALGSGVAAFNEDKFTAGDVPIDAILRAAQTLPMMSKFRFVLVRNLDRYEEGESAQEAYEKLLAYLENPSPTTCVVLTATKLDGRRKLSAVAKKKDIIVDCAPLSERELTLWSIATAKTKGAQLDAETAALLVALTGTDMGTLGDAIERLALYVGAKASGEPARIDADVVRTCVVRLRAEDTWALVDAVGERNLSGCLRIFRDCYDPKDRGLPMLGAIAWSVRQILNFTLARARGVGVDEAARSAGVFMPQRAREMDKRMKVLTPQELSRWLTLIAETDAALKGSKRPAEATLETLLMKMCKK